MKFLDETQLVFQQPLDLVGNAVAVTVPCSSPREVVQELHRVAVGRAEFSRVFVAKFVQRKLTAVRNFDCSFQQLGIAPEEPRHLLGRLQVSLGIGKEPIGDLTDRTAFANRDQRVLQEAAFWMVVMDIIGGSERNLRVSCQAASPLHPPSVVRHEVAFDKAVTPIAKRFCVLSHLAHGSRAEI